ncbi:hypothetical protein BG011_000273 [Mortierella polycephala]|uniref:FAD-binding domain-containing protein n=1 Tax=Mortierella polycephala TaxID=41804 RepID=A0A9P6U758_9FUNG|nr:hypothetical protein BG011_000273 [Mortierella polycephala]
MSSSDPSDNKSPRVLIVGAGLGGLMLGIILERAGIDYCIFERAAKVKPLGSAMSLGPNILPVFEQLGLMEELDKISVPLIGADIYNVEMQNTGYEKVIFARPRLYELMLKQVPEHKVFMNKRVLRMQEKDDQVFIHCSDNTSYNGDILVGADGAYSAVRQNMYKELKEKGILPNSDTDELTIGFIGMVGVAEPKDPSKYPQLQHPSAQMSTIIGENRLFWGVNNCPDNQLCWALYYQFKSVEESKSEQFRNSEWGPEANEAMIKQFYDHPCPYGGKMGDLIDDTPKDLISKVFIEDKMFDTWFHSRVVLLGDACHKMLPGSGQGAVNAMQDAVILANCLYDLVDASSKSITTVFQDYYDQRYPLAKHMLENSRIMSKAQVGQSWWERALRYAFFNLIPDWVQQHTLAKNAEYRPQIAFLPLIENRGTGHVLPQKASRRHPEEQALQAIVAV